MGARNLRAGRSWGRRLDLSWQRISCPRGLYPCPRERLLLPPEGVITAGVPRGPPQRDRGMHETSARLFDHHRGGTAAAARRRACAWSRRAPCPTRGQQRRPAQCERAPAPAKISSTRSSPSFILTGTGVIKLDLYDSWSTPQVGATVAWSVWGSTAADYRHRQRVHRRQRAHRARRSPSDDCRQRRDRRRQAPLVATTTTTSGRWTGRPRAPTWASSRAGRRSRISAGGDWAKYWTHAYRGPVLD